MIYSESKQIADKYYDILNPKKELNKEDDMNTIASKNMVNNNIECKTAISLEEILHSREYQYGLYKAIIDQCANAFCEYILEKHFDDIISRISPEAIANMTIAKSGAAISASLTSISDVIPIPQQKETKEYNFLGGLKKTTKG